MIVECTWICDHCGVENALVVDPSGGPDQDLVEDCPVCCHPHRFVVRVQRDGETELRSEALR